MTRFVSICTPALTLPKAGMLATVGLVKNGLTIESLLSMQVSLAKLQLMLAGRGIVFGSRQGGQTQKEG